MIILIKEELTENENENENDEKDEKKETPLRFFIKISWSNCYGAVPCCLIVIFMFLQKSI